MANPNPTLVFKVRRSEPVLVCPAKPTPNEVKSLAFEDHRMGNRVQVPTIMFFRAPTDNYMKDKDPAKVIKAALAEALVHYYPLAGRLKNAPDWSGGLVVDCTAEGVGFVEADADVRLDEFGKESPRPPFPCVEQFLYYKDLFYVETLGCPIFAVQVTRLVCGGFIVTATFSHVMSDLKGTCQFLTAIMDFARGAPTPLVPPVWQRELLDAPHVTPAINNSIQEKSTEESAHPVVAMNSMVEPAHPDPVLSANNDSEALTNRPFFFGPTELDALRRRIPDLLLRASCSSFDLISASLLYCHTISRQPRLEEEARITLIFDVRRHLGLPSGYYGNACVSATVACPVRQVSRVGSFGYLVEQVKKAKAKVTIEYIRHVYDMQMQDLSIAHGGLICTDWTRAGLSGLDYGWGEPVYAGNIGAVPPNVACIVSSQKGRLVNICLPVGAMARFAAGLDSLIHAQ